MTSRLTKDAWIATGFEALTEDGPDALKAETLASRIGATKGSFYWHFADVPAFHAAIVSAWAARASAELEQVLDSDTGTVERLRQLAEDIAGPQQGTARTELAMRAWARGHTGASKVVARVDDARLALFRALLSEAGISNPEIARIIYAAGLGMAGLQNGTPEEGRRAMGSLVDLVLALR